MTFKKIKLKEESVAEFTFDSGMCEDCNWDGLLVDAIIEYDWDDFKGIFIPYPTCPKCDGGIGDYYCSSSKSNN